jgi:CubicO group peptidase (beta-lactamase class C family)
MNSSEDTLARRRTAWLYSVACGVAAVGLAAQQTPAGSRSANEYFPERWTWEQRVPEDVGMSASRLQEVVTYAAEHEAQSHRDGADLAVMLAGEPYNEITGPTMSRGSNSGLVLRHGYIVLEWGDTGRVDWTFSATKSYVATMIGLAYDAGLIRDLEDPVVRYVRDGTFDSPHNSKITWVHLLQQTSEWQGTLWGKPDWADRYDGKQKRPVLEPGSTMTYNDVRVNLAAYAALHVWRRPLPVVLKEAVMDPIGASTTWRWWGYRDSWVEIDGTRMQSVGGGGHWGGGLWISARDPARRRRRASSRGIPPALGAALVAQAALLPAAERRLGGVWRPLVDADDAELQAFGGFHGRAQVVGPHVGRQPVRCPVGERRWPRPDRRRHDGITGPKISSWNTGMSGLTPESTVGSKK